MRIALLLLFMTTALAAFEEGTDYVIRHIYVGKKKEKEPVKKAPVVEEEEEEEEEELDLLKYIFLANWGLDD